MEYNGIYTLLSGIDSSTGTLSPSIEATYGPYDSVSQAYQSLTSTFGTSSIPVGLTVGIKTGNTIKEYWFNGGTAQSNLVPKVTTSSSSGGDSTSKGRVHTSDNSNIQDTTTSLSSIFPEATVGDFCVSTVTGGLYLKYSDNGWLKVGTGVILTDTVVQTANIANAYVLSYK